MTEWLARGESTTVNDMMIMGKTVPGVIVQILQNRGCDSAEKIEKYFKPSLTDLHDPFLMNDMEKAVDRIITAINEKEQVAVRGDYDTDGITGTALIVNILRKLGLDVEYYIPRRLVEGYGLSRAGIERAIKNRCSLIITVDCGITALREISFAGKHNIDVIVCDHHKPKDILPDGYALLNPKIAGDKYPFKELAGVGVAFKMIQALYTKLQMPKEELYKELDLVALGSVVDIVPLVDENRILVKNGLKKMMKSRKPGFRALLEETGLKRELTSYHLGFIIGPRINACGRLHDAKAALELFLTTDTSTAVKIARTLSQDNRRRKEIEGMIYQEARSLIEQAGVGTDRVIVMGSEQWHEGVVGIVASRISKDYYRPTILLTLKKDMAKGSARSIPNFDIIQALSRCDNVLSEYGGHSQAAGLEMRREKLFELRDSINEYAKEYDARIFQQRSLYDIKLGLDEITPEIIYFLKYFEPTGMANPMPVFLGKNFEVVGIPRIVGNNHLKFALRQKGKVLEAIAFGQAENILDIEVGKTRVDCLYSISQDSFTGKRKVVLKVKEMKKSED